MKAKDKSFLFRLFASTRIDIAMSQLPEAQKAEFMRMQFDAQQSHYARQFKGADNLIVRRDKQRVGRLYVHRQEKEIRLVDLVLKDDVRGQGIGAQLISSLLVESRVNDCPVRLHVMKNSRAYGLYERLGFRPIAEKEHHLFMEFCPPSTTDIRI